MLTIIFYLTDIMSNQKTKINKFFKSLKFDKNCPVFSLKLTILLHEFMKESENKVINLATLQEIMIYNKIITTDSTLNIKELISKINHFKEQFKKAKTEAQTQNKKLLVTLGETHNNNESLLLEMIILSFLQQEGINLLLTETSQDQLESLKVNYKNIATFFSTSLALHAFNMDVKAIDPLNKEKDVEQHFEIRNRKINESILKHSYSDAVAIVGEHHLTHIVPFQEIQEKFIILPVLIGYDLYDIGEKMFGKKLLQKPMIDVKNINACDIRLSTSVESFSVNKILEIFFALQEDSLDTNKQYVADFAKDTTTCESFKIASQMSELAGLLYQQHAQHDGTAIEDL